MRKIFLIARSNIRKSKGQTIAIIVLIFIAALMLNLWLMLSMDYKANFDRYHDRLNAEHVTLNANDPDGLIKDKIDKMLQNDERVDAYSIDRYMYNIVSLPYNDGNTGINSIFMKKNEALSRKIGKVEIIEEDEKYTSGVYLPMLYKSDKNKIGSNIELSIGSQKVNYTICGFFNSVMLGSHNCVLTELLVTDDIYEELEDKDLTIPSIMCSVRLKDRSESLNYEAELKSAISQVSPGTIMESNCYDIVSQSRYISQMICSGILSAMAFFILIIALVVIMSNIINYIQVNIKNLGALKAVGYTSRQLIFSLLLQFAIITFISAIIGIGVSYCLFPYINSMMIAQTGIPYSTHFLPIPLICSIMVLIFAVTLTVWYASRKIRKIAPITALRSGLETHNFKKNHAPLKTSKMPLNLSLGIKNSLSFMKYNVTICITMLVLSLVVVFSGLMNENMIKDTKQFVDLIVGETCDSMITVQEESEEEFCAKMSSDSRVEKIYLFHFTNVSHVGGAELMCDISDDFSNITNQGIVFDGRFPKYDNEIAIGAKYAKENGLKIGNEAEITVNGNVYKYLICGLTQVTNNLGRDCLLTRSGYEHLDNPKQLAYYIHLADGTDIDAFNQEIKDEFGDSILTMNANSLIEGNASVYVSLMMIIVIAIIILSLIIIIFVLYLLVRTMLNNNIKNYGIFKAIGFTTKQLIVQTAFSFMPAIIISTIIGIIVCMFIINPLMALFLSELGIVKCTFTLPIGLISMAGVGIILFTFILICLLSLRIKKIAPKELFLGE